MLVVVGAAAFFVGILITAAVFISVLWAASVHRRERGGQSEKKWRKIEFSKLILALVLSTYFIGVAVGVKTVLSDIGQLSVVLTFIGAPTAAAIGFYVWKAKAENIIKIKQAHPEETAGIPVDLNNIHR